MTINVEIVEPRVCLVFDACNSIITANTNIGGGENKGQLFLLLIFNHLIPRFLNCRSAKRFLILSYCYERPSRLRESK
jgi:hypothetical protein